MVVLLVGNNCSSYYIFVYYNISNMQKDKKSWFREIMYKEQYKNRTQKYLISMNESMKYILDKYHADYIAKPLPLLRLETHNSLILSYL